MSKNPCDEPLVAVAQNGNVHLEGACDIAIDLTPDAAFRTGDGLIASSAAAFGQRTMKEIAEAPLRPPLPRRS